MLRTLTICLLSFSILARPAPASALGDIMPMNTELPALLGAVGTMGAIAGAHLLPGWLLAAGVPTYVGGTIAGSLTGVGFAAGVGGLALGAAAGVGAVIAGYYLYNWLRGQSYMSNRRWFDQHMYGPREPRRASSGVTLLGSAAAAGVP